MPRPLTAILVPLARLRPGSICPARAILWSPTLSRARLGRARWFPPLRVAFIPSPLKRPWLLWKRPARVCAPLRTNAYGLSPGCYLFGRRAPVLLFLVNGLALSSPPLTYICFQLRTSASHLTLFTKLKLLRKNGGPFLRIILRKPSIHTCFPSLPWFLRDWLEQRFNAIFHLLLRTCNPMIVGGLLLLVIINYMFLYLS